MERKQKKPTIEVRPTKASIYRMAKTNPMLIRENHIKVADKDIELPLAVTFPRRLTLDDIEFYKWQQTWPTNKEKSQPALHVKNDIKSNVQPVAKQNLKENIPSLPSANKEKFPLKKSNSLSQHTTSQTQETIVQKRLVKSKSHDNNSNKPESIPVNISDDKFKKPVSIPHKKNVATKPGKLRRSLSAEHFNKQKVNQNCVGSMNDSLNKSLQSVNNDTKAGLESFSKFLNYRTTSTPLPGSKSNQRTALDKLQQPLREWCKARGKSLSNYQHLKCFGLKQLSIEERDEDKENIEEAAGRSDSYEQLNITLSPQVAAKDQKAFAENIVAGALEDLHNLILSGYSTEECEAWLNLIKKNHSNIENKPQYWECRAGIEQGRGNIATAVECYQNSIINGANVDQIDESLGQLLSKFGQLNIEASGEKKVKAKEQNFGNIIKSMLIKFAIEIDKRSTNVKNDKSESDQAQKRQVKVTPVRRSARKSCPRYQNTPGKVLCESWSEVENSTKENVEFKNNSYLA